jgi:hypothetical protein
MTWQSKLLVLSLYVMLYICGTLCLCVLISMLLDELFVYDVTIKCYLCFICFRFICDVFDIVCCIYDDNSIVKTCVFCHILGNPIFWWCPILGHIKCV